MAVLLLRVAALVALWAWPAGGVGTAAGSVSRRPNGCQATARQRQPVQRGAAGARRPRPPDRRRRAALVAPAPAQVGAARQPGGGTAAAGAGRRGAAGDTLCDRAAGCAAGADLCCAPGPAPVPRPTPPHPRPRAPAQPPGTGTEDQRLLPRLAAGWTSPSTIWARSVGVGAAWPGSQRACRTWRSSTWQATASAHCRASWASWSLCGTCHGPGPRPALLRILTHGGVQRASPG